MENEQLINQNDVGKFIIPPGGNWSLFLTSPGPVAASLSALGFHFLSAINTICR